MFAIKIRAPAKLNLALRVTGVRGDGYHEIESLFVPVTIFDEIEISEARRDPGARAKLRSSPDHVTFIGQAGERLPIFGDTISKAINLFRERATDVPALDIVARKFIPVEAGLGGGSSDAGAILKFLHGQYAPELDSDALVSIALKIGADVPFFLESKPALVRGIGEDLTSVEMERMAFVVVKPPFGVSTKEAYRWWDESRMLTRCNTDATPGKMNEVSGPGPRPRKRIQVHEIVGKLFNDFEELVIKRHPEISEIKKALRTRGALGTLMSGTGSSTYGIFRNLTEAEQTKARIQPDFPSDFTFFVCETLDLQT